MSLAILYVDESLVVLNKPAGMPTHPLSQENEEGQGGFSAFDWVIEHFPEVAWASDLPLEGGLCHRLDNDTSGALLFARTQEAYQTYRHFFQKGEIKRSYLALMSSREDVRLSGTVVVDVPIAHHAKNRRKMMAYYPGYTCRGKPKPARSEFVFLAQEAHTLLARIGIQGGRRHQIRVHAAFLKAPLVGDLLYGGVSCPYLPGHVLHAAELVLPNGIHVHAPAPDLFKKAVLSAIPTAHLSF